MQQRPLTGFFFRLDQLAACVARKRPPEVIEAVLTLLRAEYAALDVLAHEPTVLAYLAAGMEDFKRASFGPAEASHVLLDVCSGIRRRSDPDRRYPQAEFPEPKRPEGDALIAVTRTIDGILPVAGDKYDLTFGELIGVAQIGEAFVPPVRAVELPMVQPERSVIMTEILSLPPPAPEPPPRLIPIRGGLVATVDDGDFERLTKYSWSLTGSPKRYAKSSIGYMHRIVIAAVPGQQVDHINADPLDNRRSNLRFCTTSQNLANRIRKDAAGFKGVRWRHGAWQARLQLHSKAVAIGSFATEEDAAVAYDCVAREVFGEFARTNFTDARPMPLTYREQLNRDRRCKHCGGNVPVKASGQPRKFCTDRCKDAYRRQP